MREVLSRADPRSPHQPEATAEARTSFGRSCARAARRFRRGPPRADPERPARQRSRHRRLRRERARPCERRRRLVQQPGQQPRPQESSLLSRPDQQRTVVVSHRQYRARHEQTPELERWHHVVDHLPEPPIRTRPRLAQHSLLPTLRPCGDRIHSATARKACQQPPTPARRPITGVGDPRSVPTNWPSRRGPSVRWLLFGFPQDLTYRPVLGLRRDELI